MKIAIISDIHANISALEAVKSDIKKERVKEIWMLGDAFGRGPHPVQVYKWMNSNFPGNSTTLEKADKNMASKPLEQNDPTGHQVVPRLHLVKELIGSKLSCMCNTNKWVAGNHDADVFGWEGQDAHVTPFYIREIDEKHAEILKKQKGYPGIFKEDHRMNPIRFEMEGRKFFLTHELGNAGYVYPWNDYSIWQTLSDFKNKNLADVIFYGHTHVPLLAGMDSNDQLENIKIIPFNEYFLDENRRWLVNPGSIGAPSDLDGRASYAILDVKKRMIQFRKIRYDNTSVLEDSRANNYAGKIRDQLRKADLPDPLVAQEWRDHFTEVRNMEFLDGK